jgi:uncharacterized membrane protein YidH (DUF202 family)
MTAPEEPPGAAGERTALAWQRTALGVVVGCFLLAFRALLLDEGWLAVGAGLLGITMAVGSVITLPLRRNTPDAASSAWLLLLVACGAVIALGSLGAAAGLSLLLR